MPKKIEKKSWNLKHILSGWKIEWTIAQLYADVEIQKKRKKKAKYTQINVQWNTWEKHGERFNKKKLISMEKNENILYCEHTFSEQLECVRMKSQTNEKQK